MKKAIFCSAIAFSLLASSQAYSQGLIDGNLPQIGGDWSVGVKTWSLFGTGVVNCTSVGDPFVVGATDLTLFLQNGDLEPEEFPVDQAGLILGWKNLVRGYPDLPEPTSCGIEDADVNWDCSAMVLSCGDDYFWAEKGDGEKGGWLYPVVWDEMEEEWVPANEDECADEAIIKGKIFMNCTTMGTIPESM